MITKNANEIQNIRGKPPKWWPCLCKAITWCSCGGAKRKKRRSIGMTLVFLKDDQYMYRYMGFHFDTDKLIP